MVPGILGKKIGMTQIFGESGNRIPVTVLEAGPCLVQAVKTGEKDGYNAVQVGYDDTKEKHVKKPQREYLKAKGLSPKKFVRELRCAEEPDVKTGDEITSGIIQKGDFLDITGTSKGKGFQGGMKRCGWVGGKATHGSMSHRRPGSMGASSYPSRIFKGHGAAGHMGDEKVTVQNMEVVDISREDNVIVVKGAVPGASGTYLIIRYAKKKPLAPREEVEEEAEEAVEPEEKAQQQETQERKEGPAEDKKEEAAAGKKEKPAENREEADSKGDDEGKEENKG